MEELLAAYNFHMSPLGPSQLTAALPLTVEWTCGLSSNGTPVSQNVQNPCVFRFSEGGKAEGGYLLLSWPLDSPIV